MSKLADKFKAEVKLQKENAEKKDSKRKLEEKKYNENVSNAKKLRRMLLKKDIDLSKLELDYDFTSPDDLVEFILPLNQFA